MRGKGYISARSYAQLKHGLVASSRQQLLTDEGLYEAGTLRNQTSGERHTAGNDRRIATPLPRGSLKP